MELKRTLTKRMQRFSGMRRKDGDGVAPVASPSSIELPPKNITPAAQSAPATPITPGNEEEFLSIPFEKAAPSPHRSPRPALVSARSSRSASVASHPPAGDEASHCNPARSRSSSGAPPPTSLPAPAMGHSDSAPLLLATQGTARRSSGPDVPLSPTSLHDEDLDEMESAADEMAQSILNRIQNDAETQRWSL